MPRQLEQSGYVVQLNPKGAQHFTHADRYTTADIIAAEALIVSETTRRLGTQPPWSAATRST
ncbi:hypothetical protein [Streptomyces sp. NPDC059479]|uniref:hypothetical protein n=1 Tax=Streptomyces sp. NPDC059479 TaxID=3346848 RepID=UPI00369C27C2